MPINLYMVGKTLEEYQIDEQNSFLAHVQKVNLLVGPNNSGKSRFLRTLLHCKMSTFSLSESAVRNYAHECRTKTSESSRIVSDEFSHNARQIFNWMQTSDYKPTELIKKCITRLNTLEKSRRDSAAKSRSGTTSQNTAFLEQDIGILVGVLGKECESAPNYRIYIPSLRGLRHPQGYDRANAIASNSSSHSSTWINDDPYKDVTMASYFSAIPNTSEDSVWTGLKIYAILRERLLGNHEDRESIRDYEQFLSRELFDGKTITLTPSLASKKVTIKIGDEADRAIDEVGDGLQQMVILTWPAFMQRDKPLLLLIEEPELYLHPGAQRQLMRLFCRSEGPLKHVTVFAATHSNHLTEIAMEESDISLFTFEKLHKKDPPYFYILRVDTLTDSLLDLIGARLSSVFRTNATIWVEGISDRIYLRKFIELCLSDGPCRALAARVREDWQYTICEYAGANLEHFDFRSENTGSANASLLDSPINAGRLCARGLVVADTDSGKDVKHKRLLDALGAFYYPIDGREIENLLSPRCLHGVLQTYEGGEKLPDPSFLDWATYRSQKIGTAIRKFRGEGWTPHSPLGTKPTDGITDKLGFARKAVEQMTTWGDLTPGAQQLALRALAHVVRLNGLSSQADRVQSSQEMMEAFTALAPHIDELENVTVLSSVEPATPEG